MKLLVATDSLGFVECPHLHTPQLPPSLLQCLQYLQFLQAEQDLVPEQVPSASVLLQQD
jgi:hypothetical protein